MARKPTVASLARDLDTVTQQSKINFTAIASVGDRAAEIEKNVEAIRIDHDARIATLQKEIIETVSDETFGAYTDKAAQDLQDVRRAVDPKRVRQFENDLSRIKGRVDTLFARIRIYLITGLIIAAGLLAVALI